MNSLAVPKAIVMRFCKEAVGGGISFSKDSQTALCRAATVFILYLGTAASDRANASKRATASGADVVEALRMLDFDAFVADVSECLKELAEENKRKKALKQQQANVDEENQPEEQTA